MFAEGCPDYSIIGVDEIAGLNLAQQLAVSVGDESVIRVANKRSIRNFGWSISCEKGQLLEYRKGRQTNSIDLTKYDNFVGRHSYQNAASAYATCRVLGLSPRKVAEAMKGFNGLAHRSQKIAIYKGLSLIHI